VVQITICMESILRRLWALQRSQKAYNVYFFAQVCGSQNRQRHSECQCANYKRLLGIGAQKALSNTLVLVHVCTMREYGPINSRTTVTRP
jgi:hypothetical protein